MTNKFTISGTSARFHFVLGILSNFLPAISFCLLGSIVTLGIVISVYKSSLQEQFDRSVAEVNFAAEQVHQLMNYVDVTIGSVANQILAGTEFSELALPRTSPNSDADLPRTLVVMNPSGETIVDFHPEQPWLGRFFSNSDFFVEASAEEGQTLILGSPEIGTVEGSVHFPLASAVFDNDASLKALIVMMVDSQAFQQAVSKTIDDASVEVILMDQGRGVRARLVSAYQKRHEKNVGLTESLFFSQEADLVVVKTVPGNSQFNLLSRKPLAELHQSALAFSTLPGILSALFTVLAAAVAQVIVGKNRRIATANALVKDTALSIPGVILRYLVLPDGKQKGLYANGKCKDLLETTPEEIQSDVSRLWSMTCIEDAPGLEKSLALANDRQTVWAERWRVVTPSGKIKWLQGRGVPNRMSEGSVLWNTVILEVTELVAAQEELAKSQESLAFATRQEAVGRVTAGVAHEFNNLMAIVMGNVELVLDSGFVEDEEARLMLHDALVALRRGAQQTSELLQFGMRARLCPEITTLNVATNNLASILANVLPENISIEFQLEQNPWPTELDVGQLESAIVNAILNSRDALPKGGNIKVKTENLVIDSGENDVVPEGEYAVLTVWDDGIGMRPEVLSKAIDPYFTTKPVGQGTGLGLSAIHGFVNQTNGYLELQSSLGQGTAVRLWFKKALSKAPTRKIETARSSINVQVRQNKTILLVEDNLEVSVTMQRQLASMGYDVEACYDGASAWKVLQSNKSIDLVLTDVVMPGEIQGDDLIALAASQDMTTPFIALTGYSNFGSKENLGFPVLMKPVSRKELEAAIDACFAK
ncbi:MAG: ATP-binding protein [Pseudomonadota bacterium]